MSRDADRQQLLTELTKTSSVSPSHQNCWSIYTKWCEANEQALFVDDPACAEQQLLRFLHSSRQVRGWAPKTCALYVGAIRRAYRAAGYPNPAGSRVSAWRMAVLRENGGGRALVKVDALTPAQIAKAADNRPVDVDVDVVRRRGLIAAAEALGLSPFDPLLSRLPGAAMRQRSDGFVITHPETGRRFLLDASTHHVFYAALCAALRHAPSSDRPLAGERTSDRVALTRAWQRAFAAYAPDPRLASWLSASDPAARAWWLLNLDCGLRRRIQDRAYLLLGVLAGHRHATMARLTLSRFQPIATGYSYEVAPHEEKGGLLAVTQGGRGRAVVRAVEHLEDDAAHCPVWCPACALHDQLVMRRHHGAGADSPLIVALGTVNSVRNNRLPNSHSMTGRMRVMLGEHISEDQWVSTRSLRVTSATLARSAGMTVAEVAQHLGHYWPSSTEAYLRRLDPLGMDLVLDLAAPGDGALTS